MINTDPNRKPDAYALLTVYPGAAVLKELDRHVPTEYPSEGEVKRWTCSCEAGSQHLPPARTAASAEAHALGHAAAVMLGMPLDPSVIAGVHFAHHQRIAHEQLKAGAT